MRRHRPLVVATALLLFGLQLGGCAVGAFVAPCTTSSSTCGAPPPSSSSSFASAGTGTSGIIGSGSGTGTGTGATSHAPRARAAEHDDCGDDDWPAPQDGSPAYRQQTPHSGRHFLPSHPSYHRRRRRSPSHWRTSRRKRDTVRSFVLRRLVPNALRPDAHRTKTNRFMEGWYYRLTLPPSQGTASFAFIFSIDDPVGGRGGERGGTDLSLSAAQVMGPDDGYIVQTDRDDAKFWAWEAAQGLGCTFEWEKDDNEGDNTDDDNIDSVEWTNRMTTAMHPEEWRRRVRTGFQMLPTSLQGRLVGRDGTERDAVQLGVGNDHDTEDDDSIDHPTTTVTPAVAVCDFDMSIEPLAGWGDDQDGARQRSTAGWLAGFAVFEPHWQVTLADARATGSVNWNGTRYNFTDAPFYAEKNWGGAFPSKWYWVQCNAFEGYDRLSVTAGGGTHKIPLGQTESLGMVSIHYDGVFYEGVPWTGSMEWDVDTWGKWVLKGRCTSGERLFEAEVRATCDPETTPGVTLRAPTQKDGLAYFCRDSFLADTTLSLWALRWDDDAKDYVRVDGPPIIDCATSKQGGVEVGGGPWWDTWKATSNMKQPMRSLVAFPYKLSRFRQKIFGARDQY